MFFAVFNDIFGNGSINAGDVFEQRDGSSIEFDTDMIYCCFDYGIECLRKFFLIYIMLILTDSDGFRFDFDKFCQRVLYAAGNGYGTANGNVEIRQFFNGEFGSGIDGSTGFIRNQVVYGQIVL